MPFVEIFAPAQRSPTQHRQLADAVHHALVATIGIPADDRFQAILPGAPPQLIYDRGYLGVERGPDFTLVRITLRRGRSAELKRARPDVEPVLVGAVRGIEATLLPRYPFRHYLLPAEPLYRRQWWKNFRWPWVGWRLWRAVGQLLERERPWIELVHPEDYALYHGWLRNVKPAGMSYPTVKYRDLDAPRRAELRAAWNEPVRWPAVALAALGVAIVVPGVRTFLRERQ